VGEYFCHHKETEPQEKGGEQGEDREVSLFKRGRKRRARKRSRIDGKRGIRLRGFKKKRSPKLEKRDKWGTDGKQHRERTNHYQITHNLKNHDKEGGFSKKKEQHRFRSCGGRSRRRGVGEKRANLGVERDRKPRSKKGAGLFFVR